MSESSARNVVVDIGQQLDTGEWSGHQKLILLLIAMTVVIDGLDIQVLGLAIPALMTQWGGSRSEYAPILAIGLLGMTVGTLIGGFIGDKAGRRVALIGSVFIFGVLTASTCMVNDLTTMTILRFLAGLGLGGAIPNATTLSAEVTPIRGRSIAVILTIVGVPLGGVVGGLLAENIIPAFGWRGLFVVGGLLPIIMAILLFIFLPESPRFLVRFKAHHQALANLMARLGKPVPPDAILVNYAENAIDKSPMRTLFSPVYLRDTLALWVAFFFCLIATYSILSWLPAVLAASNVGAVEASKGITYYNLGGVLGALIGSYAISCFGSRPVQLTLGTLVIATALYLSSISISAANAAQMVLVIGLLGVFLNALQTSLYALAAHVYVSGLRASGTGGALGVGRLGGILSSFIVPFAMNIGGSRSYFIQIALAVLGCMTGLITLNRHIPRLSR